MAATALWTRWDHPKIADRAHTFLMKDVEKKGVRHVKAEYDLRWACMRLTLLFLRWGLAPVCVRNLALCSNCKYNVIRQWLYGLNIYCIIHVCIPSQAHSVTLTNAHVRAHKNTHSHSSVCVHWDMHLLTLEHAESRHWMQKACITLEIYFGCRIQIIKNQNQTPAAL